MLTVQVQLIAPPSHVARRLFTRPTGIWRANRGGGWFVLSTFVDRAYSER